jgi:hypothetical protein
LTKIGLMRNDDDNINNNSDNKKSIEELCRIFVEKGKRNPNWIIHNIVFFQMEYKDCYDRIEISGSTIRNYQSNQVMSKLGGSIFLCL